MAETDKAITEANDKLINMMGEMTFSDKETEDSINELLKLLGETEWEKRN